MSASFHIDWPPGNVLAGKHRVLDLAGLVEAGAFVALSGCQSIAGLTDRREEPGSSEQDGPSAAAGERSDGGAGGASKSAGAGESGDDAGGRSARADHPSGGVSSVSSEAGEGGQQRHSAAGGSSGGTGSGYGGTGTAPIGIAVLTLLMEDTTPPDVDDPAAGGTCIATGVGDECDGPYMEVEVTDTWTRVELPFAGFTEGVAAAGVPVPATGDEITGLVIINGLEWGEDEANPGDFTPLPAPIELVLDELSFY